MCIYIYIYREREIMFNAVLLGCPPVSRARFAKRESGDPGVQPEQLCIYIYVYIYIYTHIIIFQTMGGLPPRILNRGFSAKHFLLGISRPRILNCVNSYQTTGSGKYVFAVSFRVICMKPFWVRG